MHLLRFHQIVNFMTDSSRILHHETCCAEWDAITLTWDFKDSHLQYICCTFCWQMQNQWSYNFTSCLDNCLQRHKSCLFYSLLGKTTKMEPNRSALRGLLVRETKKMSIFRYILYACLGVGSQKHFIFSKWPKQTFRYMFKFINFWICWHVFIHCRSGFELIISLHSWLDREM